MANGEREPAMTFLRRAPILRACRDGAESRQALEESTDASGTTAYRATVELTEGGLFEQHNSGYRTTATGDAVSHATDAYLTSIGTIRRLEPLFERISYPELLENAHLLADAELLTADPGEPYWLTERLTDQLAETDFFRGLDPLMGNARQYEISLERVEAGADFESVIGRDRMSEWGDLRAGRLAEAMQRLGECNAYVGDDLPFPLQIYDETVVVIGLDDETGVPAVCAVTDRAEARDWALALYRRYERAEEPVDIERVSA